MFVARLPKASLNDLCAKRQAPRLPSSFDHFFHKTDLNTPKSRADTLGGNIMERKGSGNSRPHPAYCTHEQVAGRANRGFFDALTTPWEEFYRSQTQRLSCIAAKIGVPEEMVEDVVQEVWLVAIEHHEGFQGDEAEKRLSSFLGRVVRNKSIDAIRSLVLVQRELEVCLRGVSVVKGSGEALFTL